MLPKSFALSDDEESIKSIPRDDNECYNNEFSDEEPVYLNEYCSIGIELPNLSWCGYCNCPTLLTLTNTGETVSITGKWKKGRPYIQGGSLNGLYLFSQIHFHWPSDHFLNGRRYDLEMHAVHYKAAYLTEERAMKENDGTIVLVYLFEVGTEKTYMSKLTSMLSKIKNKGDKTKLEDLRLGDFMKPFCNNYFLYYGSANVSGSDYRLQWLVSCSRLFISQNELLKLKELFRSGAGDPFRKHVKESKPTSAEVFLVGGTSNAYFSEECRSEVKFSDVDETLEDNKPPEQVKSCCFLAKWKKHFSQSNTRDSSPSSDHSIKSNRKRSNSQSDNEKNSDSSSKSNQKNTTPKSKDKDATRTTSKNEISKEGKKEKRSSKSSKRKSESCDCTNANSETQNNSVDSDTKLGNKNSEKENVVKRKRRNSPMYDGSSEDEYNNKNNKDNRKRSRAKSIQESEPPTNTKSQKKSKEMGQHQPIIVAPAFIRENTNIMISVGTMTTHPPPPNYIRGTDLIGEGSDFFEQETSISCSQIWNREDRTQQQTSEKADKMISIPDRDEKEEDLELLPIRTGITEERMEENRQETTYSSGRLISEDEQSINSVLATIAKDPSLSKVVADLSKETIFDEGEKGNIQSLTKLLFKISQDRDQIDLLIEKDFRNEKSNKIKITKNSSEISPIINPKELSREIYVQTESIQKKPSIADSDKSFVTARSSLSINKSSMEEALQKLTNCYMQRSKRSFIINLMTEMTKNPNVIAELVKTSKETSLADMISEALRDLEESKNEKIEAKTFSELSNETTQTLLHPVQSHSKTPSSVSNNLTEHSHECIVLIKNEPSRDKIESNLRMEFGKQSSQSIKSTNNERQDIKVSNSNESELVDTSLSEIIPKYSGVFSSVREDILFLTILSRITSDTILAKDLINIVKKKSACVATDLSTTIITKSSTDNVPSQNVSRQLSTISDKITEKKKISSQENDSNTTLQEKFKKSDIELFKNTSNDSNAFAELIEALLVSDLYEMNAKNSSTIDSSTLLKKQNSIHENEIKSISSMKMSKQPLKSKKESVINRKDELNDSRIIKNRSAQNVISNHRSVMNMTPSKKRLLIEKLDKACTICPGITEILKSVTLIDIINALLKDPETADRSVGNHSFESILSIISRELSLKSESSVNEIHDVDSEKSKDFLLGMLKTSNKSSKISNVVSVDENNSNYCDQNNNCEKHDSENVNMLVDILTTALDEEKRKSLISLTEKTLEKSSSVSSGNKSSMNEMKCDSIDKKIMDMSSSRTSCKQQQSSIADMSSGNSSAADFLIELLEKSSSATEIAMTLKSSCMIKLLETVVRVSTMAQSAKIGELSKLNNCNEIELSSDLNVKSPDTSKIPSAVDLKKLSVKPNSSSSRAADDLLKTPINLKVTDNPNKESLPKQRNNPESSNKFQTADEPKNHNSGVISASLTKILGKRSWKDPDVETLDNDHCLQRRDQERNHVNFETVSSENSIDTERPEVEKLHRQEDLNESIKSRRSTDTKRSGDEEILDRENWKISEESIMVSDEESTSDEVNKAKSKNEKKEEK